MKTPALLVSFSLATATVLGLVPEAIAGIKNPNDHPDYTVELEPHVNAIFYRYDYAGYHGRYETFGGDPEFGLGFRATIELADPAFIPKLNNTVGISFGVDFTNCQYCNREDFRIWTPVTMQWNFFFNDKWSAFGDLGLVFRTEGFYDEIYVDPAVMFGGRYHFNDDVSLTLRIGIPFITFGVSFFAG